IGKFRGELKSRNIRYLVDDNEQTSPGWKFNQWEMKGVPLRVEIGPRDLEKNQIVLVRRDIKGRKFVSLEKAAESIEKLLETIQNDLFKKALDFREKNTFSVENYDDLKKVIEDGGFVKAFWVGNGDMEAKIQQETKATIRCILFDQKDKGTCFYTKKPADKITIFAKSY
ncbi:MAG: proline--tRNA ligase, partial [Candidatus Marinimicrobia bacterium]|nr:proline--tRNA ligase [Candidatus Neomarinimicrobiota bacterium]